MKNRSKEVNHRQEASYRNLVQNIKDYAIFMLDKKGKIISWDQGGVKLFGYKRNEIIGKPLSILFTRENARKGLPQKDMEIAIEDGRYLLEREYVKKNKSKFWGNGLLTSTRDKQGKHQGFSKILRDASEQNDLHKTALHNSTHDFLTGLPNRNFVEEDLLRSLVDTKEDSLLGVFYMDFNNFKRTNDELGHAFGDLVLIEIAHRLSRSIRSSDIAARFGGDEFVIIAKDLGKQDDAVHLAEKILRAFRAPIVIKQKKIQTSVSMGIALYPNDGKKPTELFRFSDMALYQAKKSGGNQYQFYVKNPSRKKSVLVLSKN